MKLQFIVFLLGSDEAGKLDVSNAFERIQKQGLNEEIVGGVTSSIVDGIVGYGYVKYYEIKLVKF